MHPSLESSPLVVVGFSAGALATPTVAAALRPDAVVIVGGAANAAGVATESVVSSGGIRLTCEGQRPNKEQLSRLRELFLKYSRFDAYHTAPLLAGIPVLAVDAGMDTWVPTEFGDLLYERLGRPDRLHMALGGHGMLFYFLPRRADWIADWVGRAAGESRVESPPSAIR